MADWLDSGWPIVALIGGAVLLFNIGLIFGLRSGATQEQIEMIRKAVGRARNPWSSEDEALAALRKSVAGLKPEETDQAGEDG
ncbi:MAG: hypothetical protein WBR18_11180 [Anaerolineales bacterium]